MKNIDFKKIKTFFRKKPIKKIGLIFVFLFLIFGFSYFSYSLAYAQKFYLGMKIGQISLVGFNKEQAKSLLEKRIEQIKEEDLKFGLEGQEWIVDSQNLKIEYDIDRTIDSAWALGHGKNFWDNFKTRLTLLLKPKKLYLSFSYNQEAINQVLQEISSQIEIKGQDASLEIKDGEVLVIEEKRGKEIKRDVLDQRIVQKIGWLDTDETIEIPLEVYEPKIFSQDILGAKNEVQRIIKDPVVLRWEKEKFELDSQTIGSWLEFANAKTQKSPTATRQGAKVYAQNNEYHFTYLFNQDKIKASIESISREINRDPKDAKLTISNGRAVVFQSSEDGYELDQEKTLEEISQILNQRRKIAGLSTEENPSNNPSKIDLAIKTKKPAISNETINDLGIKEMIGKGTTSFAGSPENRKYNIRLGASIFNGVLIKPGEIFSFLEALGNVSEERGFRKELVIKEDRTEPEVGGGLCQVSTTMFRAALNTGMEILERTNHKYRVSYYEPPVGMDATVYDPSPDLKFKNNTPGYILIQGKVSGNYLTFEFYGTKDGRKIEISQPKMYDVVSPSEPLYIEDSSLGPGEEKRLERAHDGAKAEFYYKVISKNGEVLFEKTFYSKYVAWRAVYLRGPQPQEQPPAESPPQQEQPPACTESCSQWSQTGYQGEECGTRTCHKCNPEREETENQTCSQAPTP